MANLLAIVLAAGEGTRMRSDTPKVLHEVGGAPMVSHVLAAATRAGSARIALVSRPEHSTVRAFADTISTTVAHFEQQPGEAGTGYAARMAMPALDGFDGHVISLLADAPLVSAETIAAVSARLDAGADVVVVGFEPEDPKRFGRLIFEGDRLVAIREFAELTDADRVIRKVNSGIIGFRADTLREVMPKIGKDNAKGEYYLTDAIELANASGRRVEAVMRPEMEVMGVDDRAQLARAEAQFQEVRREDFMKAGVTLRDPSTVYFSFDTEIGRDVVIEPNVWFGPGVKIGDGSKIFAFSHIEHVTMGPGVTVGPFARIRGGAVLEEDVHLGNFVEVKKSHIGKGTKAGHLSYLGDAEIGEKVNIGAGTITCNYDGVNKSTTTIGDGAFIGSNASLVAPVTVGAGAYTASGSVITKDVPPGDLAVGRARQENKPGYAAILKSRAEAIKRSKQGK